MFCIERRSIIFQVLSQFYFRPYCKADCSKDFVRTVIYTSTLQLPSPYNYNIDYSLRSSRSLPTPHWPRNKSPATFCLDYGNDRQSFHIGEIRFDNVLF